MNRYKLAELDRGFDGTSLADRDDHDLPVAADGRERMAARRWSIAPASCSRPSNGTRPGATRSDGREAISEHVVHVAAADGRTLMILPLAISAARSGCASCEFLGGTLTDYNAPLIDADFRPHASRQRDFARLWRAVLGLLPKVDVGLARAHAEDDRRRAQPDDRAVTGPPHRRRLRRHAPGTASRSSPPPAARSSSRRSGATAAAWRSSATSTSASRPRAGERIEVVRVLAEQKSHWLRSNGYDNAFEQPATREFYERLTNQPAAGRAHSGRLPARRRPDRRDVVGRGLRTALLLPAAELRARSGGTIPPAASSRNRCCSAASTRATSASST